MTNFKLIFEQPWFLLLMIPALAMTLIPYFRLKKRYRKTRNRISSMVLHMVVTTLCVLIFAGMKITYDLPNTKNEVILLVDTSYSGKENEVARNGFVESVINSTDSRFQLGIVTFGYDQVYAVELTDQMDGVYAQYLQASHPNPNLEASDIASALEYASTLFSNPESARIVLISDGVETDNAAEKVIRSIAAEGIKVDTVHFPNAEVENEIQLLGITTPDQSIRIGETFSMELMLQSKFEETRQIEIRLYDNDEESTTQVVDLVGGIQTVQVETQFPIPGPHKLTVEITRPGDDTSTLNNTLNSYMHLEVFDKVLILESIDGEADQLKTMLQETMQVTVINIRDAEAMPKSVNDLRAYDEVVLCNIANKDMPEGFDQILHSYVYDVGGGLFTVGGNTETSYEGNWQANAYTRDDMYGTLYQKMLPVEIIRYTPPTAVMIIIDQSSSMMAHGQVYEQSKIYAAKQGASVCLDELSDRDYVGIMTLDDDVSEEIALTPRPQRAKILAAIDAIGDANGGTIFTGALQAARQALVACTKVEKRHIILVTDGKPGDDSEDYLEQARLNAEAGITMSIVGIQCDNQTKRIMLDLVEAGGGEAKNFYDINDVLNVATQMREDLKAPEIKDVNYETFVPTVTTLNPIVANIPKEDMPSLDGFYGSKLKKDATEILSAEYVPVYAQWKYGKGMVGSFMCDLNGTWSSDFVEKPAGALLVNNIIQALFPSENIRTNDIQLELYEDNYHNTLSVLTPLQEGQQIQVTVTGPSVDGMPPEQMVYTPTEASGQTRVHFQITTPGLHTILVQKFNADGTIASERTCYKSFSYSEEYREFSDMSAAADFMAVLAKNGGGEVIANDDPWAVFLNVAQYLHKVIDPRLVFAIIALVLFLLDLAARKFKFKWPHELVREYKKQKFMR